MSGSLNLIPYTVTATGTITTNSTRIAGFTVVNKSSTTNRGATFQNIEDDGTPGTKILNIQFLGSVGTDGGANRITQTYSGNTGVYFKNGVFCSIDTSCYALMTTF